MRLEKSPSWRDFNLLLQVDGSLGSLSPNNNGRYQAFKQVDTDYGTTSLSALSSIRSPSQHGLEPKLEHSRATMVGTMKRMMCLPRVSRIIAWIPLILI